MAGTWLSSETTVTPNNYVRVRNMRAYEEGVQNRMVDLGQLVDNPHPVGSPEALLWIEGWSDASGGTIDHMSSYHGDIEPA
jgi:hypothetical protein